MTLLSRKTAITALVLALSLSAAPLASDAATVPPPAPVPPLPTPQQLVWHETETFSLIHYGLNTYTNREWGYGDESPALFNPKKLDANQVIAALKRGGMNGVILVAKHHDGFCLWPSKTTPHNIAKAPWRDGKGDLVREYADAARTANLRFGIYCSPWDRNNPEYARPAYVKTFHAQLVELLTGYGELFEFWFDGANGGDGYYGGAREKRSINAATYYQWDAVWKLLAKHQPSAVIFSDVGPGARWVGNERGYAAPESWPTITPRTPKSTRVAVGQNVFKEVAGT
ncbi:MAG: alpha-L-fucosidase, partial [Puniceicoccales bacterium]|nr:alpha-L-fucosidase [Puniceicoccales bacterium]